jgi:O-antigen/teichoic acid export membrane protein
MATEATASAIRTVAPARSGRFALNLVSNIGRLGLTMLVGAWYVPFLVRKLGPAAYGLVPLASMITSYMGLITFSLDLAMGRYLNIALARQDHGEANKVFNVALCGNAVIVALLAIPALAVILNVEHLVRIPPGYEAATRWLFAGTAAAFFLNEIKTPFLASCFAMNRLDLQNVVVVAETLTRVGLVAFLFLVVAPRIEYVGAGILAGTVISTLGAIWLWKVLTPNLHIRLRDFDWTMLKNLCHTSGWIVVSQIGLLLYANIDLVLANQLFGPGQSGRYAAVLALPLLLRSLNVAVGGIFAPTMFRMYARGEFAALESYLNRAIKFVGLVMALCIGLICGFAKPLLTLWLGPEFGDLAPLLFLMAISLCLALSMYPMFAVPFAANRVKAPGLVTVAVGLINVALVFLLAKTAGWGLYGIAAAGAISVTLREALFAPFYGAVVLQRRYRTFYRQAIPILAAVSATIGLCRLISWRWTLSNWVDLGMAAAAVSLVFGVMAWWRLSSGERAALKEAVIRWKE